ncbi:MAG: hypothetical protein K1X91_00825 [Bacteriodetes bacterium]|nr:hypothetical protein [Bacteroidota bacterium]
MKKLFILLSLSIIIITDGVAQINQLGLYVDINGKVKFWESKPNRNGNIDDTVYITYKGVTHKDDLRNLKYDYLTLLEAPDVGWSDPSNADPSRINDTSRYESLKSPVAFTSFSNGNNTTTVYYAVQQDFSLKMDTSFKNKSKNKRLFSDEIRGVGLTDSVLSLVKSKLKDYIHRNYGKPWSDENIERLHHELSSYDTVIDGIAKFDYLVDFINTYEYDNNNRLTRVVGYHWSQPVEVDSIKYDKAGNLIYFSREQLGMRRSEYIFRYNKFGRVINATECYKYAVSENANEITYYKKMKFTYNNTGIMNSKADLLEGNWNTYFIEIKKK